MSVVYCRWCRAPTLTDQRTCQSCGAWDPGGQRSAAVGAMIVATMIASAITSGYAIGVSHDWVWERWQRRFDLLPDGHALRGHSWDVAFVLGVAVFVVAWVLGVAGLYPRTTTR